MKTINLDENEINILERFAKSNSDDAKLIKKIFNFYIYQSESIRNIDPKGNVGLQTCSAQVALEKLEMIYDSIFSIGAEEKVVVPQQPRRYR